jgi:shikimate kinase
MKTGPGSHPAANSSAQRPRPVVRAVFLVGFMGAGKSSVGRVLARQMDWPFEDLDERLQAREKRSIEQIFRESGEAEFRRAEHDALRELLAELGSSPRVVALGGGAFVQAKNATLLAQAAVPVVFLDAPVEELFRRCQQEPVERPLRRDQEQFRQLYQARRPHYMAAALRIETGGKDVETVAAEVAQSLGLRSPGLRENGESQGVLR